MMSTTTIDLGYKSPDGKEYHNIVLNLKNGEWVMVKNASCYAHINKELQLIDGNYKIISNSTYQVPVLSLIPKKYHKYFKTV